MFGMIEFLTLLDNEDDRRLFEKLYLSYKNQMQAVARSILLNDADAEDAVHDAFLKLAKKFMPAINEIEDERDRRNYLLKMTKNIALNIKRDRKPMVDPEDPQFGKVCRVSDDSFIGSICNRMECLQVIDVINSMSPAYKDVLYYHFVLGMTIPQTAKALGRKEMTVRKQLSRGKKLLLDAMKAGGDLDVND